MCRSGSLLSLKGVKGLKLTKWPLSLTCSFLIFSKYRSPIVAYIGSWIYGISMFTGEP